jgi:hypothetical protein
MLIEELDDNYDYNNVQWLEWHRGYEARYIKSEYLRLKQLFWANFGINPETAYMAAKDIFLLLEGNNGLNRRLIIYCFRYVDNYFNVYSNLDVIQKLQIFERLYETNDIDAIVDAGFNLIKVVLSKDNTTMMSVNYRYCYELIHLPYDKIGKKIRKKLRKAKINYKNYRPYTIGKILAKNSDTVICKKVEYLCGRLDLVY